LRQDAQSLGIKGLFCVVGVQQGLSGFGAAAMKLPDLVVIAEAAHALLRQRIAISGRDAAWPQNDRRRDRYRRLPLAYLSSGVSRPNLTKCLSLLARPA
jgi:hypothetical protein